jgi:hypothetical protein
MSEGQSQRSVAFRAEHRQEAEVAAAEERVRAVAETAATAARLAMAELAAARAEVEAAAAADAARATELKALRATPLFLPMMTETTSSSWRGRQRGSRRRSGQPNTPRGAVAAALMGTDTPAAFWEGAHAAAVSSTAVAAQTGADVPTAGLTEIMAFTGGATLPPWIGTMVTMGSRSLSGTPVPAAGGLPSPRPTTSSGPQ